MQAWTLFSTFYIYAREFTEMSYIIYRKSDRAIVGHVFNRRTESDTNQGLAVELNNILNSELGGKAEDYSYITAPVHKKAGHVTYIDAKLNIQFQPDERSKNRASALSKLERLGLTPAEILAII